jgi:hypothetical protein
MDRGLTEWGGRAHCTEPLAVAMGIEGIEGIEDLRVQGQRLRATLESKQPLSRYDWTRMLLATEIVFASDVAGSGIEWPTTTGLDDVASLGVSRGLQRKLVRAQAPIGWGSV